MSQKKIGAKIVIDGEQEFRSALQQSKNSLKEFDSELKLVTSQFKKNEQSMDALKAKQAVYQKQQQELAKQSKLLVEQIQKASQEYKKAADAQEKQAEKIKKLEKALEQAKKEYGDSSDEVRQLERELADANDEYEKQDRAITGLTNKITKWNTDLNNTKRELNETDDALDETNKAILNYDTNLDKAESETKEFGQTMGTAGNNTEKLRVSLGSLVSAQVVVDVLRNCARAIKEVATAAVDVGAKFEASMSKVEALSGATGDSLAQLTDKAKEMGKATIYSASESADAFSYMALAGWKVEEMLEGIEPVLNLAAAANMDLAEASDIVTDYITAFGLKAEDAAHFSDAMATAMSTSNTTVELLGESYKNCAATCGSMGIAMEDATAVLATMANAGVKGGEAGTALNSILTRLATNTSKCGDMLKKYGVDIYDAEGNMKSISSILNGVAESWDDLSQKEQAALAKSVAGVRNYSKFQTIMLGVSEAAKEGGQSFDDYAEALRNCDGAAEQMAKTMQDNLTGDITILKSALEGLGIATEGVFDDAFRIAVQGATDAVSQLEREITRGELGVSLAALGDSISELTENLIEAATDALPGFIDGLRWMVDNVDLISGGIKTVTAAYVAYKVATIAATISTESLTAAIAANPIGFAATAITAATVALYEFCKATDKAKFEESEFTKETNKFINEHRELADRLDDSAQKRQEEVAAMDSQLAASKRLINELFNETTSQERKASIITQLKDLYPKLNVAMNEYGEIVGATKSQMDAYVESSIKMAKVEAAREHLTEIAKDQFEAEMALADAKEKVKEASKKAIAAEQAEAAEQKKHVDVSGEIVDVYNEYDAKLEEAQKNLSELKQAESEETEKVKELGDEYNRTMEYIDNNAPLDEAADSTNALAEAEERAVVITEEMEEEFNELQEAIANSISSSLDLTNKWSQEWSTSTQQMTENVDSQIEGIQNWADNFDKLANQSKVAIDDRVMKYLADMGTEGAGLVQQLVDTLEKSPDELQAFSDSMAKYLTLEDTVAAQIKESYVSCVTDGITEATEAIANNNGAMATATQEMADALSEGMEEAGQAGAEGLKNGLESGADEVNNAAKKAGESAVEGFKSELGENGETVGEIGEASDEALAEAFTKGKAKDAALTVSQEMVENMSTTLSEDEGYKIGETFMGGMKNAIELLGEEVIAAATAAAEEAKRILSSVPAGGGGGGGGNVPGHADGLDYVPYDNYLARLHEGERVLTKEENAQYMALLGDAKAPSFNAVQSRMGDLNDSRAVVINNDIKVDGAQDPEAWTQTFIRTLKREARMA